MKKLILAIALFGALSVGAAYAANEPRMSVKNGNTDQAGPSSTRPKPARPFKPFELRTQQAINSQALDLNQKKLKENISSILQKASNSLRKELGGDVTLGLHDQTQKINNKLNIIENAITEAITSTPLQDSLTNPTSEKTNQLTDMLQRVITNALTMINTKTGISWCDCEAAPLSERIMLTILLVNDVLLQHPDNQQKLVYASLAAGSLLQDYLIIQELKTHGYNNIDIHIIEIGIKDKTEIHAAINNAKKAEKKYNKMETITDLSLQEEKDLTLSNLTHAEHELDEILYMASIQADFNRKIGAKPNTEKLQNGTEQPGIYVYNYENHLDYLAKTKKYNADKANILIMLDPDRMVFPINYPSAANGLAIAIGKVKQLTLEDDFDESDFSDEESESSITSEDEYEYEDDDLYTDSFFIFIPRDRGIKAYQNINFTDPEIAEKTLLVYNRLQALITQQGASTTFAPELKQLILAEFQEGSLATIFPLSDAYLALQDILRNGLANPKSAIVYNIDYNPNAPKRGTTRKLNPITYADEDVIAQQIGKALEEDDGFKPVDFTKPLQIESEEPTIRKDPNPVLSAASAGDIDTLRMLINSGADLNLQGDGGLTALMMVAYLGHNDIIQMLITAGANLNLQEDNGNTALMMAITAGHNDIVQMLIDAGADLNLQDINGSTALMYAKYYGHMNVVETLTQAGADLTIRNNQGLTAMDILQQRTIKK